MSMNIDAGVRYPHNYMANGVSISFWPFKGSALIAAPVMRSMVIAAADSWEATWCAAYPSELIPLWTKPTPHRPWFDLAWITYLAPRFAPLVTPPSSAITERLAGGGLLMTATDERFCTQNPQHLAVARDIEAARAPINALPWPPDA